MLSAMPLAGCLYKKISMDCVISFVRDCNVHQLEELEEEVRARRRVLQDEAYAEYLRSRVIPLKDVLRVLPDD